MIRARYPTDLTDRPWRRVAPHLPAAKSAGRPQCVDRRDIVDAILSVLRNGIVWRALPHDFPPWRTVSLEAEADRDGQNEDARSADRTRGWRQQRCGHRWDASLRRNKVAVLQVMWWHQGSIIRLSVVENVPRRHSPPLTTSWVTTTIAPTNEPSPRLVKHLGVFFNGELLRRFPVCSTGQPRTRWSIAADDLTIGSPFG
jgi:transposase